MARHTVTLQEFYNWENSIYGGWKIFARSGGLSDKILEVCFSDRFFRVTTNGEVVYMGNNVHDAISEYNAAP